MNNQLFTLIYDEINEMINEALTRERVDKIRAWKLIIYKCDKVGVDFYEFVKNRVLVELSVENTGVSELSVENTEISETGETVENEQRRICRNCSGEIPNSRKVSAVYCSDRCKAIFNKKQ